MYYDCDKIYDYNDIVVLTNGKATIKGKINRATEGILFLNKDNRLMDGPGVIRFIIEPANMTLKCTISNDTAKNIVIKGSYSQQEKDNWEAKNASLFNSRVKYENEYLKLFAERDSGNNPESEKQMQALVNKLDSFKKSIIKRVLECSQSNPDSYFSGYLLDHYKRNIPIDTLKTHYGRLHSSVIYSDFGKLILSELFKLTDDLVFREKFADSDHFKALKSIKTIYDVSLTNLEGTKTSFSDFKGNFILIDFWGSWCGPCFKNAPALSKLVVEMKDKPIVFVSVSLDNNPEIWKRSIKKYDYPGVNLFDDKGLLSTFYNVLWVPRYILIKPDGTVANGDAPHANSPELSLLLTSQLTNP